MEKVDVVMMMITLNKGSIESPQTYVNDKKVINARVCVGGELCGECILFLHLEWNI